MKEHGLLFKGAMVRALLTGRKTETRRPIAPHNTEVYDPKLGKRSARDIWDSLQWDDVAFIDAGMLRVGCKGAPPQGLAPRIMFGHRIWARETWWRHPDGSICFRADQSSRNRAIEDAVKRRASDQYEPWSSPLHLKRADARAVLDVTEPPFPQRIGTLTPEQVTAEGFPIPADDPEGPASFREYWQRIHGAWTPELLCWCYPGLQRTT